MARKEHRVLLGIVIAVALLLRIGYVAQTHVKDPLRTDAGQYARYAHNIVHHGVFSMDERNPPRPDSFRSPGYPLFLAAAKGVAGEEKWYPVARWTQVGLGTAMVPLTFALATLFLPFWAALVAAAMVAMSPHLVTSGGYILTETLFGTTLLLGLLLFCRGVMGGRRAPLAGAGLVFGFGFLTNEACLFLPLALLAALALRRAGGPAARTPWLIFVLLFGAVAGGWLYRNHTAVPAGAPTSQARALATLSHGTYPGWVHSDPRYRYSAYLEDPEQPEFGSSWERFGSVFWQRLQERPLRHLAWYLFEKPYYLWSWSILQGQGDVYVFPVAESLYETTAVAEATRWSMAVLHPVVLVLAALGALVALIGRHRLASPIPLLLTATAAYFTVVYSIFAPWPRYSVPLRPELYLLATWAVAAAVRCTARPQAVESDVEPAVLPAAERGVLVLPIGEREDVDVPVGAHREEHP